MLNKYIKKVILLISVFLLGSYLISLGKSFSFNDGIFVMSLIYIFSILSLVTGESPTTRDRYKYEHFNSFNMR